MNWTGPLKAFSRTARVGYRLLTGRMKMLGSSVVTGQQRAGISEEDVVAAYRMILGRVPESDEAIRAHLTLGTLENRGQALISSVEFKAKHIQAQFSESKWVITPVLDDRYLMWVDLHDRYVSRGCLNDDWEPSETGFFISRLREGDTVLDIGANIGWFTLVAAKHIGSTGTIYSFEPRPETAKMLAKTIAMNRLNSIVRFYEYALSDFNGELLINWGSNTDNPGGSFVTRNASYQQTGLVTARVRAARLDDILPDIAPNLIKIDVEGAEPLVFSGAVNALRRRKPVILSELHPSQLMRVSGVTASQYISQMEELGYTCYLLEDSKPTKRLKDFPSDWPVELASCIFE